MVCLSMDVLLNNLNNKSADKNKKFWKTAKNLYFHIQQRNDKPYQKLSDYEVTERTKIFYCISGGAKCQKSTHLCTFRTH